MDEKACSYKWTPGKFVIVDNSVTYHSRQPFTGARKCYAAIGKGTKEVTDTTTHLVLNSGDKMPSVGLGLWKIPKKDCAQAVYKSIEAGYRLLDSACDYGNEQETGEGIKNALYYNLCKREDLFVVSKLWNTFHKPEHVELACKKSMADLGVDYLDLYLIHFPIAQQFVPIEETYPPEWQTTNTPNGKPQMVLDPTVSYQDTWKAMEALVEKGLVRNIGFCNIGTSMIRQVLSYCKIKPAVLQVEMHPYLTQEKLLRYTREQGIQTMAFSCLGSASYVELDMAKPEDSLMETPVIKNLAGKYGKTPAQILLRWGVQRGTTVIPKSVNPQRQIENIGLFDFNISEEDMNVISGNNQNRRFNDPGVFAELAFGTFCPIYE